MKGGAPRRTAYALCVVAFLDMKIAPWLVLCAHVLVVWLTTLSNTPRDLWRVPLRADGGLVIHQFGSSAKMCVLPAKWPASTGLYNRHTVAQGG